VTRWQAWLAVCLLVAAVGCTAAPPGVTGDRVTGALDVLPASLPEPSQTPPEVQAAPPTPGEAAPVPPSTATAMPTSLPATATTSPTEPPTLPPTPEPAPLATVAPATATIEAPQATPSPALEGCPYIGNQNTGKFHRADCRSVQQMAEQNKVCLMSREEAVARGFVPCKICSP